MLKCKLSRIARKDGGGKGKWGDGVLHVDQNGRESVIEAANKYLREPECLVDYKKAVDPLDTRIFQNRTGEETVHMARLLMAARPACVMFWSAGIMGVVGLWRMQRTRQRSCWRRFHYQSEYQRFH